MLILMLKSFKKKKHRESGFNQQKDENLPPLKFLKPGDKIRLLAGGTDVGDINIENVNSVVC